VPGRVTITGIDLHSEDSDLRSPLPRAMKPSPTPGRPQRSRSSAIDRRCDRWVAFGI